MGALILLDTETTGLDPERHEIWEMAYATLDGPICHGVVPHSLRNANPDALALNGYYQRGVIAEYSNVETLLRKALEGATIVGANPGFDAAFLKARWGVAPWHHRPWDVEAYAAGVLDLDHVPGLMGIVEELMERGYDPPEPDHTARGDVMTLRYVFLTLRQIARAR